MFMSLFLFVETVEGGDEVQTYRIKSFRIFLDLNLDDITYWLTLGKSLSLRSSCVI